MEIGLVTAILDQVDYREMIDTVSSCGYQCVEVAAWPIGGAERRYAGVSHINAERVLEDNTYAQNILEYAESKGVRISALAFYPNTMDGNLEKRKANIEHLKNVICASAKLGVNMVTTFIGRDQFKTVEENLELVKEIWPPIVQLAEKENVKIAIENCPMLFGEDQWPGGQNLFTSPVNWRRIFEILPSRNLGINYDPSHFVWQQIDYIKPLYEFRNRIFHVHFKDIKIYQDKLDDCGIMAYPLDFMAPKLPGLGDVQWGKFVSALNAIRYDGPACIEVEDRAFEGSKEKILESLVLSKQYMNQIVS